MAHVMALFHILSQCKIFHSDIKITNKLFGNLARIKYLRKELTHHSYINEEIKRSKFTYSIFVLQSSV